VQVDEEHHEGNESKQLPLREKSLVEVTLIVCTPAGIVPDKKLFSNWKFLRPTRFAIFSGIVPIKLLSSKPKELRLVSKVILLGMVPFN